MKGYGYYQIGDIKRLLEENEDTLLKCMRIAVYFVNKYDLQMEPEDLFHEAIVRLFEDKRHIPKDVPVHTSIGNVMKSISYDNIKLRREEPLRMAKSLDDNSVIYERAGSDSQNIEKIWITLTSFFIEDIDATAFLAATEDGQKKAQIVNTVFGGDQKRYDTARRKIIRSSEKLSGELQ
jgi:DNA-directed RNA polymerase specialized sigma24 family protein